MHKELWTIGRILQWTEQYFRNKGIEGGRLDGEVLLSHILGQPRIYLYTNYDKPLEQHELDAYRPLVMERVKGFSVAAIIGEKEFMGLTTFAGNQPTLREATIAKNYLNEKELRAMGQLVSGYLDFAERQAEREQAMTMQDWSEHLDRILTMSGEQLLIGNGSVSHKQAIDKATGEYRKYKARTLSEVERDYLDSIKLLEQKTDKK